METITQNKGSPKKIFVSVATLLALAVSGLFFGAYSMEYV